MITLLKENPIKNNKDAIFFLFRKIAYIEEKIDFMLKENRNV